MLSFKDLIANDIENVFENPGEFAEELEIVMGTNGRKHKVVGVIDTDTEAVRERKVHYVRKRTEDLGMGIAVCDARLFVKKGKIKFHVFLTCTIPAQEIEFVLEYDPDKLANIFA